MRNFCTFLVTVMGRLAISRVLARFGPGIVMVGLGAAGIGACNGLLGIRELDGGGPAIDAATSDASPFAGWGG